MTGGHIHCCIYAENFVQHTTKCSSLKGHHTIYNRVQQAGQDSNKRNTQPSKHFKFEKKKLEKIEKNSSKEENWFDFLYSFVDDQITSIIVINKSINKQNKLICKICDGSYSNLIFSICII